MTLDLGLAELAERLRRSPEDPDLWLEVVRRVARHGRLPPLPPSTVALPFLLGLWKTRPHDRSFEPLVLGLRGLEACPRTPREDLGSFWAHSERRVASSEGDYDAASGLPLRVRRRVDGAEMVLVPAGSFVLGSEMAEDSRPLRQATLGAYWIDREPVTVARFLAFGRATGHPLPRDWHRQELYDRHPVVLVDHPGAEAYAGWAGARLPTEAQWEKAARGVDGRHFPWGVEFPTMDRANYWRQGKGSVQQTWFEWDRFLTDVDAFPAGASPFGCLDMVGNASEWCADWYHPDPARFGAEEPAGPPRGDKRVRRGGSWRSPPGVLFCWYRLPAQATRLDVTSGFRLALPVGP